MSIWAVKLSTWIDKKDPDCSYKSFVKDFIKMKICCSNPKCNKRLHYGMVDLHSAPFGMADGPFCSFRCYDEGMDYRRNYKPSKRAQKRIDKEIAKIKGMKLDLLLKEKEK